jgi:GTP-binding protein
MVPLLPEPGPGPSESDIRVAVVGKPNVGKSSLVNRLFGEERMVVSEVPGTTRDPVDLPFKYHGKNLVFVDTAGLRRQARIDSSVEYYSSLRTARVVRQADVCVVLVDAAEGMTVQDIKVAESAWDAGCGVIVACNKWDLVDKETNTAVELQRSAGERVPFLKAVPFAFVSALTGQRARKLLDLVLEVEQRRRRRVDTHEVNEVVRALVQRQPPPHARGRPVKIKYATQADVEPPTFVLFSNLPGDIPSHYERYLVNGFRAAWDFEGCPIRLRFRKSSD